MIGQRNPGLIVALWFTASVTAPSPGYAQTWVCPEGKCMLPGDVSYPCPGCGVNVVCECSKWGGCPAETVVCYWYVPPGACVPGGGSEPSITSVNCSKKKVCRRENLALPDCSLENPCIEITDWYNSGVLKYHTPGGPCLH